MKKERTEERKNRFTGQSYMLTKEEANKHDAIFINELAATIEDKERDDVGISKNWELVRRDLDWFREHNAEAYMVLLRAPKEKIAGKIYNAGYENHSVKDIAETVKNTVGDDVKLITTHSDDNRSYHVSSKKIQDELGFVAKHTIKDAVKDLCDAFEQNLLPDSLENEIYFNIKRMNNLELQ